jgi:hypothetical protein
VDDGWKEGRSPPFISKSEKILPGQNVVLNHKLAGLGLLSTTSWPL